MSISHNRSKNRVGLRSGLTGVPTFLIYFDHIKEANLLFSLNYLEAKSRFESTNQKTWKIIQSFYEAGGKIANFCTSPLFKDEKRSFLGSVIGENRGYARRTGIYKLGDASERSDLVVIPQASSLLSPDEYQIFCLKLFDWLELRASFFAILDIPSKSSVSDAMDWVKPISTLEAAFYYPEVLIQNEIYPVSPVVAACYQRMDQEYSIAESPANLSLGENIQALIDLNTTEAQLLRQLGINPILSFPDGSTRIWGAALAKKNNNNSYMNISARRTSKALREAILSFCFAAVLEPLTEQTQMSLQQCIENFFLGHHRLFEEPIQNAFRIQVSEAQSGEASGLRLDCEFKLKNHLSYDRIAWRST